ncbi:MAG: hypothetical protein IJS65_06130, partial [Clostridia bacterium]|nr:hypothetical protein [Clostridia bacterium]
MKKPAALLLALIMALSVFAACGEKTEAPADSQIQAGAPSAAANAPADEPDGDEKDKDTTEITAPDAPVIIAGAPSGADTEKPTESDAPQISPPQSPSRPAEDNAPAPQAQSSPAADKIYRGFIFGDSFNTNNAMIDNVIAFASYDGITLKFRSRVTDTAGRSTSFNLYELCNLDGARATSVKNTTLSLLITDKETPLDFLVLNCGRDHTAVEPENAEKALSSLKVITDAYLSVNPSGKIVALVPAPYGDGNDYVLSSKLHI